MCVFLRTVCPLQKRFWDTLKQFNPKWNSGRNFSSTAQNDHEMGWDIKCHDRWLFEKSDRNFLEHVMYLMYLVLKPCWLIIILGLRIYIKSILSTKKLSMGNFVCISGLVARDWCKYFYFPRNIFIFKIYFYFPRNISIFQEMEGWKYSWNIFNLELEVPREKKSSLNPTRFIIHSCFHL